MNHYLNISEKKNEVRFDTVKARSHDLILRIQSLVPKIGSRRSDDPISTFHICDENVGRSFVVCSHDPIFRTKRIFNLAPKRSQGYAKFVGAFQEECQMKIEHVLFPFVISELRIRVSGGHFQCVQTIRFSDQTKIGSLKMDRVNRALRLCLNGRF